MNNLKKILLVVLTSSILEPYSVQASTATSANCTKMFRPFVSVSLRGGKNNIRGQVDSAKLLAKYKKSLSEVLKNSANITVGKAHVTGNEKIELGSFVNNTQGNLKIDNTKEGQEAKKNLTDIEDMALPIGSKGESLKIFTPNLKLSSGNTQAEQNLSDNGLNIVVKNTVNVTEDNAEMNYASRQITRSITNIFDQQAISNISAAVRRAFVELTRIINSGQPGGNQNDQITVLAADLNALLTAIGIDFEQVKALGDFCKAMHQNQLKNEYFKPYQFDQSFINQVNQDFQSGNYLVKFEKDQNSGAYVPKQYDLRTGQMVAYNDNQGHPYLFQLSDDQAAAYNALGCIKEQTDNFDVLNKFPQVGIGLKGSTQDNFVSPASNLSNTISITDNGSYNLYSLPNGTEVNNFSSNQMLGELSFDLGARIYLGSKAFILPTVNFYIPMIGKELLMTAEGNTTVKKGETTNDKGISIKRNFGFGGTLGVGIDINEFVALYAALGAETSGLEGSEKLYEEGYNSSFKLKGWNLNSEFGAIFNISHFAVTAALQYRGGTKNFKVTETKGKNGSDSIYNFDQTSGIGFKFGISCIF